LTLLGHGVMSRRHVVHVWKTSALREKEDRPRHRRQDRGAPGRVRLAGADGAA